MFPLYVKPSIYFTDQIVSGSDPHINGAINLSDWSDFHPYQKKLMGDEFVSTIIFNDKRTANYRLWVYPDEESRDKDLARVEKVSLSLLSLLQAAAK